eukprot:SAG22_NODE_7967_length_694_cov_1.127731_2_plen_36_part_01
MSRVIWLRLWLGLCLCVKEKQTHREKKERGREGERG